MSSMAVSIIVLGPMYVCEGCSFQHRVYKVTKEDGKVEIFQELVPFYRLSPIKVMRPAFTPKQANRHRILRIVNRNNGVQ